MKSTKKVRAQSKQTSKSGKKSVVTKGTKVKKSEQKTSSKKVVTSATASKCVKKSGKSARSPVAASRSPEKSATKNGSSVKVAKTSKSTKEINAKRKKRELTPSEYHAFVVKTAKAEQVRPEELVTVERRRPNKQADLPQAESKVADRADSQTRRPKVQRRRQIDPTTCERDYTQEEIEFMNALDEYKRNSGRMFPTCSEILEVFRGLGYIKQSHEESIEINANPESGDVFVTTTETSALIREEPKEDSRYPVFPFTELQNTDVSGNQTPFFL